MARVNVTIPDDLAALVRDQLPGLNISGVLAQALSARLDCKHHELECSCCRLSIDRQDVMAASIAGFISDAMFELAPLVDRVGTAEGAARILRNVAIRWGVGDDGTPLPRPSTDSRRQALAAKVVAHVDPHLRDRPRRKPPVKHWSETG